MSAPRPGPLATALDFVLRLAFFAAAPFLVVRVAALFPITGALVQIGVGLLAFFTGEALRRLTSRSRLLAVALGNQLKFEAYYRERPPRPFLYYVFYPLLFPYWLAVPEARREFLLFKGYTLASFAVLLGSLGYQYFFYFPPELGALAFLPLAGGTLLVETGVVLAFLMPLVTSVVHFHRERASMRLGVLLMAGLASVAVAVVRLERRRDPVVSYATRMRVGMRTRASAQRAAQAQEAALRAAWKALPHEREDVERDGKVQGDILEAAERALEAFYKDDEAHAFDLWYARRGKSPLLVLYFETQGKRDPIWLAMTGAGAVTHDAKQLPRGAFDAMWKLTQ